MRATTCRHFFLHDSQDARGLPDWQCNLEVASEVAPFQLGAGNDHVILNLY